MEHILVFGLLIAFCFFFKGVYDRFSIERNHSKAREIVDQQLAAAFISIATDMYKERSKRPDMVKPIRMQNLIEQQDDLVELYFNQLEEQSKSSVRKGIAIRAVK